MGDRHPVGSQGGSGHMRLVPLLYPQHILTIHLTLNIQYIPNIQLIRYFHPILSLRFILILHFILSMDMTLLSLQFIQELEDVSLPRMGLDAKIRFIQELEDVSLPRMGLDAKTSLNMELHLLKLTPTKQMGI